MAILGKLGALHACMLLHQNKNPRLQVFGVPIVLVSLVDSERQWFKSSVGLQGVTETARHSSFCAWTLLPQDPECLVVSDARSDARFRNNPLVSGPPYIQFYAGCPLVSSSGQRMGSLCAIDKYPRHFTSEDCNLLCNLAEFVVRELEVLDAQVR
jgi:GAF domain-containing protein